MLEALILKQPISLAVHAMEKMRVNADIKDLKMIGYIGTTWVSKQSSVTDADGAGKAV